MPRQYRVIDVVPNPPMTASSSVTAQDIEAVLNVQAKEGWELLTVLETFFDDDRSLCGWCHGQYTQRHIPHIRYAHLSATVISPGALSRPPCFTLE
jgi:hypothetical protein